jgi:uncharacterized protein
VKIRIIDIAEKERVLTAEEPAAVFPPLLAAEENGDCRFLSPIRSELTVTHECDHIRAHGRVEATVELACSRCLAEFSATLRSAFTIFYTEAGPEPQDEEVELAEEDLISVPYRGDEIDFAPEIAEQLMLEIPFKPLCRETCAGLCPTCGADMNTSPCDCPRQSIHLGLSALHQFTGKK